MQPTLKVHDSSLVDGARLRGFLPHSVYDQPHGSKGIRVIALERMRERWGRSNISSYIPFADDRVVRQQLGFESVTVHVPTSVVVARGDPNRFSNA